MGAVEGGEGGGGRRGGRRKSERETGEVGGRERLERAGQASSLQAAVVWVWQGSFPHRATQLEANPCAGATQRHAHLRHDPSVRLCPVVRR